MQQLNDKFICIYMFVCLRRTVPIFTTLKLTLTNPEQNKSTEYYINLF